MVAITIGNQVQSKTQTADRLCYLFIVCLALLPGVCGGLHTECIVPDTDYILGGEG